MGNSRNVYKVSVENLNGKDNLEGVAIDGRIILKCITTNRMGA
jgi:hypothetical protein